MGLQHLEVGGVGGVEAAHNQHEVNPLLRITLPLHQLCHRILPLLYTSSIFFAQPSVLIS